MRNFTRGLGYYDKKYCDKKHIKTKNIFFSCDPLLKVTVVLVTERCVPTLKTIFRVVKLWSISFQTMFFYPIISYVQRIEGHQLFFYWTSLLVILWQMDSLLSWKWSPHDAFQYPLYEQTASVSTEWLLQTPPGSYKIGSYKRLLGEKRDKAPVIVAALQFVK